MHLLLVLFCSFTLVHAQPQIQTVAGTGKPGFAGDGARADFAELRNPYGLCIGPDAALYICDMENHVIRRVHEGTITTVAGTGVRGYSGDGGAALQAQLNEPYEVRFDSMGNMFFVEMRNHLVRRVDHRSGTISTVAGTGAAGFSGDGGSATNAQLNQPHSIQLDPEGNLYICDIGNHRIRKVERSNGKISTFAGTGEKKNPKDGGRIGEEPLYGPRAIDFDADGRMWLALREGNAIYRLDLKKGIIEHIAGTGAQGSRDGAARQATLSGPKGISVGPENNIYFADTESHSIRRINLITKEVETIAGTGQRGDGRDGLPLLCALARPHGIFVARDGRIFIGDSENNRVRLLDTRRTVRSKPSQ